MTAQVRSIGDRRGDGDETDAFDGADLAGLVALLLWGLHMVQSGVLRACGPSLRRLLGIALGNRIKAFFVGLVVTSGLQSSTATALMITSFTARGLVEFVPALAVMLGANVGTTLIVQAMAFDVYKVAPILVLAGLFLFRRGRMSRTRDFGRVAIGLGLMLFALRALMIMVAPSEDTPFLRLLLELDHFGPSASSDDSRRSRLGGALKRRRRAAHHVVRRERGDST